MIFGEELYEGFQKDVALFSDGKVAQEEVLVNLDEFGTVVG